MDIGFVGLGRMGANMARRLARAGVRVVGYDAEFLAVDCELADIAPVVADSGEGRWTVQEAVEQGVPAPVLALVLMAHVASQGRDDYAGRLLAMMRRGFGGHAVAPGGPARARSVDPRA
jgi:6-phosphogluconate dehydrogenase (decarboxylating)